MMQSEWLGPTDYISAIKIQDDLVDRCHEKIMGLEHPLTITLGKRSDVMRDIKVPVTTLKEKRVAVIGVDRGGQATLHNPGQLVIYPIINIRERGVRVRDYVRLLEDVTKRFLADYGIIASRCGDGPGLYTANGKIAFFGVRIKQGITSHGLALNVSNNLEDFKMIRSCGRATETLSKMADYGAVLSVEHVFRAWCVYFQTGLSLTEDTNRPMLEKPFELRV